MRREGRGAILSTFDDVVRVGISGCETGFLACLLSFYLNRNKLVQISGLGSCRLYRARTLMFTESGDNDFVTPCQPTRAYHTGR